MSRSTSLILGVASPHGLPSRSCFGRKITERTRYEKGCNRENSRCVLGGEGPKRSGHTRKGRAMSTLSDLHEARTSRFAEDLGRDVAALGAGAVIAVALGATTLWLIDPFAVLTGWNATAAAWSLVPALALLAAHLVVARCWLRVPTRWIDGRAGVLAALMLAPAVCLLSAGFLAGVVGLLGGPHDPNAVANDVSTGAYAVRTLVALLVSVAVGVMWMVLRRHHRERA